MKRNKQTELLGEIITLVILILLILLSNVSTKKVSYAENITSSLVNPIQKFFTGIKNKISGNDSYFLSMEKLQAENEELKEKNSELETSLRELEIIKAENSTLRSYMNLTEKYSNYDTIPAYIINRDVSNYSSSLILNVGSNDGITEKLTVIADKGLVGYISSVSENTSKVQVIVDSASAVSSNISTTEEGIICKGTIENNHVLKATYIPTGAEIIVGDTVYTSGIGGIYPKGIVIGNISEVIKTDNITDRYATVETAVDFSKLNTVLVIKNY